MCVCLRVYESHRVGVLSVEGAYKVHSSMSDREQRDSLLPVFSAVM